MIEVVTVYAPRKNHEKYVDFRPLMLYQKQSVETYGHRHVVVSDMPAISKLNVLYRELPHSLMLAIIAGQIAYLEQWSGEHAVLLADVDCLVARPLEAAFDGSFDLGLTNRDNPVAPINNGAMYVAPGCKDAVLKFFHKAQALCKKHWGGDQEAIALAAAPIPKDHCVHVRDGLRVGFFSMQTHNCVPRCQGLRHKKNPYVVHFKGDRKGWMETYLRAFILKT